MFDTSNGQFIRKAIILSFQQFCLELGPQPAGCDLLYLTTEHVFENFGGWKLPSCLSPVTGQARNQGGAFGAFAPLSKILNHCIAILTFAETFKELR